MKSQFGRRSSLFAVTCSCLVAISLGCQKKEALPDYASLGLAEVSGTIRLDEEPLVNANVIFESTDETFSTGRTNSQGKYSLMFNSEKSGVMVGEKIVRIQLGSFPEDTEDAELPGDGESPTDSSELPASYNTASQLKVSVDAGVQVFDFDLSSDGSTMAAVQ